MPSRYAYTFPVGIVQWLPPLNQIDQGENNLDGVFSTRSGTPHVWTAVWAGPILSATRMHKARSAFSPWLRMILTSTATATQQRLVRFEFRALVAFTLANGPNAGTTYYATNDLEVDEDNTTPLILNNAIV